jgi:hypothetical protein
LQLRILDIQLRVLRLLIGSLQLKHDVLDPRRLPIMFLLFGTALAVLAMVLRDSVIDLKDPVIDLGDVAIVFGFGTIMIAFLLRVY